MTGLGGSLAQAALIAAGVATAFAIGSLEGRRGAERGCHERLALAQSACAAEREAGRAAAEAAAAERSRRARAAESGAAGALAQTRARQARSTEETVRHVDAITPRHACLPAGTRRLLNAALDAGVPAAAARGLPAGAGEPAHAAATARADPGGADAGRALSGPGVRPHEPGGASARTVALWIAQAIEQHEACRAQLAAIARWDAEAYGAAEAAR